jgi:FkbM family methyltransferase
MPDWRWQAQNLKRRANELVALKSPAARDRARRQRFWKQAGRYASAISAKDRFGNNVTLNTADPWVSRLTFLDGSFDPDNVDNLVKALRESGFAPEQIVDVGANIGTSTLELLSAYPDATAVSIEPHPDNYRLLCQNVIANSLEDRVRTIHAAVGERDGTAPLTVYPNRPGGHEIAGAGEHTIDVPIRRLADLVNADRPTVLWIDVQGYEGHVLQGAGELLGCPALVEFWPRRLRDTGGYGLFLEAASTYRTVLEAQRDTRPAGDLDRLAARLETTDQYTDLLLLPWAAVPSA